MQQERQPHISASARLQAQALKKTFSTLLGKQAESPNDLVWTLLKRIAPLHETSADQMKDLKITELLPFLELLHKARLALDLQRSQCIDRYLKQNNIPPSEKIVQYDNPLSTIDVKQPKKLIVPPRPLKTWMKDMRRFIDGLIDTLCQQNHCTFDLKSNTFKKIRESTIAFSKKP